METNRLRQFQVITQVMNLRKAAEILHLSHSALSKSMKVLQEQLGEDLLIQCGRNIELTEEGQALLPRIADLLKAEEALLAKKVRTENKIRIGTFEVFSTHLLGRNWTKYFPDSLLELREFLPGQLEAAIIERTSDFGITYEPVPIHGIELKLITTVEMGIFGLEKFKGMPLEKLPFVTPIAPISGTPTGTKGLDGWPENALERFAKFKVDMMESGLALVRTGQAVIFLPHFVAHHHNLGLTSSSMIHLLPAPRGLRKVTRKVYLLTRKGARETKEVRQLASLIRNECNLLDVGSVK